MVGTREIHVRSRGKVRRVFDCRIPFSLLAFVSVHSHRRREEEAARAKRTEQEENRRRMEAERKRLQDAVAPYTEKASTSLFLHD